MKQISFDRRHTAYQRSRAIKPTKFQRSNLLLSSGREGQEEKLTLAGLLVRTALENSFYWVHHSVLLLFPSHLKKEADPVF